MNPIIKKPNKMKKEKRRKKKKEKKKQKEKKELKVKVFKDYPYMYIYSTRPENLLRSASPTWALCIFAIFIDYI